MALTSCPDCQAMVSESAPACPKCGRPMAPAQVEQTAKRWKGMQAVGAGIAAAGIVWVATTIGDEPHPASLALIGVGLTIAIVGSIIAWWRHG